MLADRPADDIIRLNWSFYEQGEKTSKILVWQTRQLESNHFNLKSNGIMINDPVKINRELRTFYEKRNDSEMPKD